MALTKVLARDFEFEVNTGTEGAPVWVEVKGIDSWSHSPSTERADTTTFDSDGDPEHLVAAIGDSFTMTGKYIEDVSNGDRDPGQEAVEAWGRLKGPASLKQFRITSPAGTVIGPFYCSASVTLGGGGNNDANKWEFAVEVSGGLNP